MVATRCRYCDRTSVMPCMSTRDMEDGSDRICYATLIALGGGEYSANQAVAIRCFKLALAGRTLASPGCPCLEHRRIGT